MRGGNSNNGGNAGAANVNVNNGLSNTNANYGARLAVFPFKSNKYIKNMQVIFAFLKINNKIL